MKIVGRFVDNENNCSSPIGGVCVGLLTDPVPLVAEEEPLGLVGR